MEPPQTTTYSFRQGSAGTGVWSLQRAFNSTGLFGTLVEDQAFGPRTAATVRAFQDLVGIASDGVCGPQSQQHLAQRLIRQIDSGLPAGLLLSIAEGESGLLIAAVNWSVPGGCDCGYVQRRVLGPPFDDGAVKRAFDSFYQFRLLRSSLIELHTKFTGRPAVHTSEFAWRLACLNHNYPSGADRLSQTEIKDLSSYWKTAQPWVVAIGAKFPDGAHVNTPLEWAQRYALGNPAHDEPGQEVKLVSDWST